MGEGKILVVALLLVVIFLGIAVFLFYLDKRLSISEKLVKQLKKDQDVSGFSGKPD